MPTNADLQSPFDNSVTPIPGGSASGAAGTSGGFALGDGSQSETPNSSGLPLLQTLAAVEGAPGLGSEILSPIDQNVHTIDKK